MTEQIKNEDSETEKGEVAHEKNRTWEKNHVLVLRAMAKLIRLFEMVPTNDEIAEETGLSRQTVQKHLIHFDEGNRLSDQLLGVKYMSSKVLAKIVEQAMDGDVRAARLSLEVVGILNPRRSVNAQPKKENPDENGLTKLEFQKF